VEPGCAIQAAIADGRLPADRWSGYLKLQREMAYEGRRAAARRRRTETRRSRSRRRTFDEDEEWQRGNFIVW
jgi:ribosome biogenesis GTPase